MISSVFQSRFNLLVAWTILSLARLSALAFHYVFPDPFGHPMVARVDRFLPFHAVVEMGSLAQILLPFAIVAIWKPGWASRLGWCAGAGYLILGQFDLEILRFFRQHATLSYMGTYLRPQAVFDATTWLAFLADPWGMSRAFGLGCSSAFLMLYLGRRSHPSRGWSGQPLVLAVFAAGLGTSPWWLNHTTNRTERLLPPTYVLARDLGALAFGEIEPVDEAASLEAMERLKLRPFDSLTWTVPGLPLLHTRLEAACAKGWTLEGCSLDGDGDGYPRTTDCDDRDPTTHPQAIDAPSDGRDQDCSGMDSLPVNILLLVVESLHRQATLEALSDTARLANFARLEALGGAWYLRGRSNGFPSVYGMASTLLGLWSHPHRNWFTSASGLQLRGIPDFLPKDVYARFCYSGADPTFDNQMPWLSKWFETVQFDPANGNDAADSVIVDQALRQLDSLGTSKPWFALLASHNTHMPFRAPASWQPDAPQATDADRYVRALSYFDHQLGRLLDALSRREDFSRTVILVTGDHGFPILPRDLTRPEGMVGERTATMVGIFSPDSALGLPTGRLDRVASQTDIGATVLGLLGLHSSNHFQGRDLRDTTARGSLYFKDGSWEYHTDTLDLFSTGLDQPVWRQSEDGSWSPWTDTTLPSLVRTVGRMTSRKAWMDSIDGAAWR